MEDSESSTGKVVIHSSSFFAGEPGTVIEEPLVVQVLSPPSRRLGRRGFREPVPRTEVSFEVRDAKEGEPAPTLMETKPPDDRPGEAKVRSDEMGLAKVHVQLPGTIGSWRIRAGVRDQFAEEKTVAFQVVSGLKVFRSGVEHSVSRRVEVAVQVFGPVKPTKDGLKAEPIDRFPVQFQIPPESDARLKGDRLADQIRTPPEGLGVAQTDLTLGSRSGRYYVLAELRGDPAQTDHWKLPAVLLSGIAVDWSGAAASLLSGLLLILLGLWLLAHGLLNLLGPALALPVTTLSRGRLQGLGGGLLAGAMFQSSASVTSRLVSFANGGLLAASGAAAMLLGANVGRTVLPQALAFPISPVAVPLLALGVLGLFLPRRLGLYSWGWLLLGAGLVVLGSWLLAGAADIYRLSPSLRESLKQWDYLGPDLSLGGRVWVFAATAAGAAAAGFCLRSSNLLVVAAIVAGNAGLAAPSLALPIVLGANLGPALAILASAVGRRLESRRIALVQLAYQGIGAAWLAVLSLLTLQGAPLMLHLADAVTPGLILHPSPEHVGHHLAMVHTLYNLLNGALCLALTPAILRLVERALPRDPARDDIKPYHLDPNLIEVPALAILQASREVTYLTELCRKAIAESFDAFRYRDLKLADQTSRREESIETVHRDVSQYLLRVGENDLSRREACRLAVLQATTGNLVRIGELGEELRGLTTRLIDEEVELPEETIRDLNEAYDLVMGQFENVLQLLERADGRTEENAVKIAERLAKFSSKVEHGWFDKLRLWEQNGAAREPPAPPTQRPLTRTLLWREGLEVLFRVASHLSHIAERMRVLSPSR